MQSEKLAPDKDSDRELFEKLKKSPWADVWEEFILSGNDDNNHHILHKNGWTWDEFIDYGIEHNHINRINYE